nr:RVT_3 domain-containing protein [Tanacetum cinerariifolium]
MDESFCVDGSGAGLILTNPKGAEFTYALRFKFKATNNEDEYEALIAGLRIAEEMGLTKQFKVQSGMDLKTSKLGLILTNPKGAEFTYALRFRFKATNNEDEYEALIAGLRIAEEMGTEEVESAFKEIKQLIAELLTLTAPKEKEELIVYLAATKEA